jgi:hypothetical protein
MHTWSEEDFDWESLDKAIDYIHRNLVRWGRINVRQSKEKFGTARIYCSLGWTSLLSITHPGYMHYRPYPKWLVKFDIYVLSRIIPYLNYVVLPYHKWLYRKIYSNAVKSYPHIKEEITCMADFRDLLKGL